MLNFPCPSSLARTGLEFFSMVSTCRTFALIAISRPFPEVALTVSIEGKSTSKNDYAMTAPNIFVNKADCLKIP